MSWLKKLLKLASNYYKEIIGIILLVVLFFLWDSNNRVENKKYREDLEKSNKEIIKAIQVERDSMLIILSKAREYASKDTIYQIEINKINEEYTNEINDFRNMSTFEQYSEFTFLANEFIITDGFSKDSL
jgi:sensor domain CHASE-containing protein